MKPMKRLLKLIAALATLAMSACATMPPTNDPSALGTLIVDGDNAYLNEVRVTHRAAVHDGDTVRTGAGTSARIQLRGGGYVQLDEDTDPLFSFISEGTCILVKLAQGQIFVDAKRICIEDDQLAANLGSRVNLWTDHASSVLTVISGHVDVTRPTAAALGSAERYVAQRGSGRVQSRLTPEELRSTTEWTTRYFRSPPVPPPPARPPPADTGWCCSNGHVFEANQKACRAQRGRYFVDERDAARDCASPAQPPPPPPSPPGWCCSNGSVFGATIAQCTQRHGAFRQDQASAAALCGQPPDAVPLPAAQGWCCGNGHVFEANQKACRMQHGRYYADERDAARDCAPPVQPPPPPPSPPGWCCSNGSVFGATVAQCTQRHGAFRQDQASAVALCRQPPDTVPVPVAQGWCCSDGRVFEANQKTCRAQHGRYYADEREAARVCAPAVQ